MKFDNRKLNAAQSKRRVKSIPVRNEALKAFFVSEDGDDSQEAEPTIEVQNLTGLEMACVHHEVDAYQSKEHITNALFSNLAKDKIEAIQDIAGVIKQDAAGDSEPPRDFLRRVFLVHKGCCNPKFADQREVLKFAELFPTVFYDISNQILLLTGLGMDLGE